MESYTINQKNLNDLVERLFEDANNVTVNKTRKKYLAELKDVASTKILTEAWYKLLESKVFNKFIGKCKKVKVTPYISKVWPNLCYTNIVNN